MVQANRNIVQHLTDARDNSGCRNEEGTHHPWSQWSPSLQTVRTPQDHKEGMPVRFTGDVIGIPTYHLSKHFRKLSYHRYEICYTMSRTPVISFRPPAQRQAQKSSWSTLMRYHVLPLFLSRKHCTWWTSSSTETSVVPPSQSLHHYSFCLTAILMSRRIE